VPELNPYAPPIATDPPEQMKGLNGRVAWLRWIISSVVLEFLLTVGGTLLDSFAETLAPTGVIIAVISGCALFAASVVAATKYSTWNSQSLWQLVNIAIWLTMLITVWQLLPFLIRNQSLTRHDVQIFAGIWLARSVGVAVTAFVTNRVRHSRQIPIT